MPLEPGEACEEMTLDQTADLDAFLRQVESSAFRIALLTVRDRDEALDIVQDAMLKLATRYAGKDPAEWKPLFYRILKNRVRDWGRRRAVRQRIMSFFSAGVGADVDPIAEAPGPMSDDPAAQPRTVRPWQRSR